MLIFDFFSGTGSSTQAFKDAGHTVITFELDPQFESTETADINDLYAADLIRKYGQPDFIWASPPCTAFSVASMGHHWVNGGDNPLPRTEAAAESMVLVMNTRRLIETLNPRYGFIIENPRWMLRKLSVLRDLPRATVTYCQYGDSRQKPTDLWGWVDGWMPRPMCSPGAACHEAAPRGSKSGTQGLANAKTRSMIPYALGMELLESISKNVADEFR